MLIKLGETQEKEPKEQMHANETNKIVEHNVFWFVILLLLQVHVPLHHTLTKRERERKKEWKSCERVEKFCCGQINETEKCKSGNIMVQVVL